MDYDATADYREALYARLRSDMNPGSQVVVIGQSLNDAHLRDLVETVIATNQKVGAGGRIFFLLYEKNENRALLYEQRGLRVAFGSLDTFISAMDAKAPATTTAYRDTGSPLDTFQSLRSVTVDVSDEVDTGGMIQPIARYAHGLAEDQHLDAVSYRLMPDSGVCHHQNA